MPVSITVKCQPDHSTATILRRLICEESHINEPEGRNPLKETEFNDHLAELVRIAFLDGRRFEREHPDI